MHRKDLRFYSQFGEDKWIVEHITLPKIGVFVDVGAGHPTNLSNSYYFERQGWDVYCIDGDSRQVDLLKERRTNVIKAVVSDEPGETRFKKTTLDLSHITDSVLPGTEPVTAVTLQSILDEYNIGKINILNVDVEGHELAVLRSFDIEMHSPDVIIVEYNTLGRKHDVEIKDYLVGYKEATRIGANLIMVKN
jgi:FkbM family methyltransferase